MRTTCCVLVSAIALLSGHSFAFSQSSAQTSDSVQVARTLLLNRFFIECNGSSYFYLDVPKNTLGIRMIVQAKNAGVRGAPLLISNADRANGIESSAMVYLASTAFRKTSYFYNKSALAGNRSFDVAPPPGGQLVWNRYLDGRPDAGIRRADGTADVSFWNDRWTEEQRAAYGIFFAGLVHKVNGKWNTSEIEKTLKNNWLEVDFKCSDLTKFNEP